MRYKNPNKTQEKHNFLLDLVCEKLFDLPPAQPDRKLWELRQEKIENKGIDWYEITYYCSQCDLKVGRTCHYTDGRMFVKSTVMKDNRFPSFCPECGVKLGTKDIRKESE